MDVVLLESFAHVASRSHFLIGIRVDMLAQLSIGAHSIDQNRRNRNTFPWKSSNSPVGELEWGQIGYRRYLKVSVIAVGFISTNFQPEYPIPDPFQTKISKYG